MNKIILASHGKLAEGMYDSVKMIIGNVDDLSFCGLKEGQDNNEIAEEIADFISGSEEKHQYIIVCDLLGGSVSNAVSRLSALPNVFVINGMNMGLVISLLLQKEELNEGKILELIDESKAGINLVQLNQKMDEDDII